MKKAKHQKRQQGAMKDAISRRKDDEDDDDEEEES